MNMEQLKNRIKHDKMHSLVQEARKTSEKKYRDNSKKRLMKNVERKFQTTMIGALDAFEQEFGYLWGLVQNNSESNQRSFDEKWNHVRTEILNRGNNQLRACLDEIAQYTMTWDKYRADFIVRKDSRTQDNQEKGDK